MTEGEATRQYINESRRLPERPPLAAAISPTRGETDGRTDSGPYGVAGMKLPSRAGSAGTSICSGSSPDFARSTIATYPASR